MMGGPFWPVIPSCKGQAGIESGDGTNTIWQSRIGVRVAALYRSKWFISATYRTGHYRPLSFMERFPERSSGAGLDRVFPVKAGNGHGFPKFHGPGWA